VHSSPQIDDLQTDPNNFNRHRAHCTGAATLIIAISITFLGSAADSPTATETARLTQMQIDALRTPYRSHPYLATGPGDAPLVALVKEMTSAAIDQLKTEGAVVVDPEAAEEIAKLIQKGAGTIVAVGASDASIADSESKIKEFAKSMLEHGDHVIGPKSAVVSKDGNELVEVHRNAFYIALRSFCPCWPFCE
jgi:hypothetical protein